MDKSEGLIADEPIRAIVRIRPFNEKEWNAGYSSCAKAIDHRCIAITKRTSQGEDISEKSFHFDNVLDHLCSQERVFHESGVCDLLNYALQGYSATVFAYGQTGSGKTFTMSGIESSVTSETAALNENGGLIPRSLAHLSACIAQSSILNTVFKIKASFLEIYNEIPRDLLSPSSTNLYVRWTPDTGFFIENQLLVECLTFDDMITVFLEGHRNRSVGAHRLNCDSSRSHCIFSVSIESTRTDPGNGHSHTANGKISFIDLAGSERLRDTKSSGDVMLKETSNINRSLFLLGKVISSLGTKQTGKGTIHVSYRDSLLTKLLMESLGGTGRTLMIACISPASRHLDETLSTLFYASRSRDIQNRPVKRIQSAISSASLFHSHIEALTTQIHRLRRLLENHGIDPDQTEVSPQRKPSVNQRPRLHGASEDGNEYIEPTVIPQSCNKEPHSTGIIKKRIEKLLLENAALVNDKQEKERQNDNLLKENNRLVQKVDNLEKVFIEQGAIDEAAWEEPEADPSASRVQENIQLLGSRQLTVNSGPSFTSPSSTVQASSKERREILHLRRTNLQLLHEISKWKGLASSSL